MMINANFPVVLRGALIKAWTHRYEKNMKRHKYNAKRTTVDGITFSSMAEAKRYGELKVMERAGLITNLSLQPKYPIVKDGCKICTYLADFFYLDKEGKIHVEDVKGFKTPIYRLKKKLVLAFHGIEIEEV